MKTYLSLFTVLATLCLTVTVQAKQISAHEQAARGILCSVRDVAARNPDHDPEILLQAAWGMFRADPRVADLNDDQARALLKEVGRQADKGLWNPHSGSQDCLDAENGY